MKNYINLDVNAGFGLLPEVKEELLALDFAFLNPSSVHRGGQKARALIESAREELCALLGLDASHRIVFTSGATEANNLVLNPASSWLKAAHIISSPLEHPSVLAPLTRLERSGAQVSLVAPPSQNQDFVSAIVDAVSPETKLASFMLANNETGEISPLAQIAAALKARKPDIVIHSDCVQALGKIPFKFNELGVDAISISGHKFGALQGVGALVFSRDLHLEPLMLGGPQENHFRAGTENVLGIASLGIAASLVRQQLSNRIEKMKNGRDYIEGELTRALPHAVVHRSSTARTPNTCSIFLGVPADDLVVALDLKGICVSSGAACASGKPEPSHVLLALGLSDEIARQTIRISVPHNLLSSEIETAVQGIIECVNRMRA